MTPGHGVLVSNQTQNTVLCQQAMVADTTLTRLFGLLGRRPLGPTEGLLIRPSSGVHTWGMTFAIDVVALDRANRVLGVWRAVKPWHLCGLGLKTRSILELASGTIDRSHTEAGDQLHIAPIDAA
jgi:uncharacterized membrane protein (UPF0127 family)